MLLTAGREHGIEPSESERENMADSGEWVGDVLFDSPLGLTDSQRRADVRGRRVESVMRGVRHGRELARRCLASSGVPESWVTWHTHLSGEDRLRARLREVVDMERRRERAEWGRCGF